MPEEAVRESGERIMGSETCITIIEKECRPGGEEDDRTPMKNGRCFR